MLLWLRSHAYLLAPAAIAIAFATVAVTPAQALWSGGGSTTASAAPSRSAAPQPISTEESCVPQHLDHLHFSGNISRTGEGPFDVTVKLTNHGDVTLHDLLLGFATTEGWEYLERIDYGTPQFWIIDGEPSGNLYELGDISPGDTVKVELHIQMTDDWADAPGGAYTELGAGVFDPACDELGRDAKIRLHRGDELQHGSPSPQVTKTYPASTSTRVVGSTQTVVSDYTPVVTRSPQATQTIEVTGTPTPEDTTEPTPSETATVPPLVHVSTATPTPVSTSTPVPSTPQSTQTAGPTGTVLAIVATPPPSNNEVLGAASVAPALPDTGSGSAVGDASRVLATLVLLAVAAGFVAIAVGVGRRLT